MCVAIFFIMQQMTRNVLDEKSLVKGKTRPFLLKRHRNPRHVLAVISVKLFLFFVRRYQHDLDGLLFELAIH